MHPRQRNGPGNGYRSNDMGIGNSSRIFPGGSMRGQRMYNSEYRNYNRGGYGRNAPPKQFQPPPPPSPLETDIFVEAGRLAAEYFVSKGVLPPNALSGEGQTDILKNLMGEIRGFRPHEVENVQIHLAGHASVLPHSGNAAHDAESGKRKYTDEYNSIGSRSFARGRLRSESLKNYGSEVKKELVKSGSWAGRSRASSGMEANKNASAGFLVEQNADKVHAGEDQKSSPDEIAQKSCTAAHVETELEKCNSLEDAGAKTSSFSDMASDVIGNLTEEYGDAYTCNVDPEVGKEGKSDNDTKQKNDKTEEVTTSSKGDNVVIEDDADLVKHIKFVNVPTKARSSLKIKGSKSDQDIMYKDENNCENELSKFSGVHTMGVDVDCSSGDASSEKQREVNFFESDVTNAALVEEEPDVAMTAKQEECLGSGSFPKGSVYKQQELDDRLSGFGNLNSMFMNRGGKRAIDDDVDDKDDIKKLKEWIPLSGSMENQSTLQEPITSKSDYVTITDDPIISLFPRGHTDSSELMEEKKLFPDLFKTCDLNLVGMSEVNEKRDVVKPVHAFPSVAETGKEAAAIDADLSISYNNCNIRNRNGKDAVNNNHIEIIDLEDEPAQYNKQFSDPQRRGDIAFTDLDVFHKNVNNDNEIQDIQDGYGLMFSELLGNGSPNSSSVATGLDSLHGHMVLPDGEGILGEDESIYMSLGEIPISLLGAWEQPTQDYGKPF